MVLHSIYIPLYIFSALFGFTFSYVGGEEDWTLPAEILIGAGTSAHQIEGAWNISDKGENVWDRYTHSKPEKIVNGSNADIACDSYHKFKDDIFLLKTIGLNHYRFSLSWSRILPTGYPNVISKDGVRYYNDLLDKLEKNNIIPFVTLYHWDHPQVFQEIGGWTNEAMVNLFGDYARVVFELFGNRVKMFSTINEPFEVCRQGFYLGNFAPGLKIGRQAEYFCTHNILKAHARAYHIYDEEFRAQQNGKIGIILNYYHYYSKYENDTTSNEVAFQFAFGRYAQPIFSNEGDYPTIIKERILQNSKFEGLRRSRLPTFSKKWKNYIKGTSDYLGLNHYTSYLVEPAPKSNYTIYENDDGLVYSQDPKWPATASNWLKICPQGFLDALRKIKEVYNNPPVYIMENGIADNGILEDDQRIEYLYMYMRSMLIAMKTYDCNIKSYTIWSLLNNFEWDKGYSEGFGLIHVNFNHVNRTRTLKKSAIWLKEVLRTRKLQLPSSNN